MLATSLQQWARRYLQNTQQLGRCLQERAQMRAFFANGITKFHIPWAVEALPALVHLSLFTFFAGLLVYLFNIDHTVFSAVICCVGLLSVGYGCITLMPIIWPDSPYYSPLSPTAWFVYTRVMYVILKVLYLIGLLLRSLDTRHRIQRWLLLLGQETRFGIKYGVFKAILKQTAEVNLRILSWTVDAMPEDDDQEKVFGCIPGFFDSDAVELDRDRAESITEKAFSYFLCNTLSSNSVPKTIKIRRLATCLDATSEVLTKPPIRRDLFRGLIYLNWGGGLDSIDIGHTLRSWDKANDGQCTPYIRGVVAAIVARARERNESWVTLARDHLGVPESLFQRYLSRGDSVLLANMIHFLRHADRSEFFALEVVRSLSKFDIRNTLPELRRKFCVAWNEVIREAQNHDKYSKPESILRELRPHYIALHRGVDAASPPAQYVGHASGSDFSGRPASYPLCNVPGHLNHLNHDGHDASAALAEAGDPPPTSPVTPSSLRSSSPPVHTTIQSLPK